MTTERTRPGRIPWSGLALGLLVLLLGIDFHLDVRARDVFSWMDPYQYYEFPLELLQGRARFDQFEIASIFPFFVLPFVAIDPGIPGALWTNAAAIALLLAALHWLRRELELETPLVVIALLLLSSPVLVGLSRTLYVEIALTALTALVFAAWLRLLRRPDRRSEAVFAALVALAYLVKTTFPVYLAAPVGGAVVARLARRRPREAFRLGALAALPVLLAMLLQVLLFSPGLGYYGLLVSTAQPFMYLMGPPEVASWASLTYYPGELGRSYLFLLLPFLALTAGLGLRRLAGWPGWSALESRHGVLWLWLAGPLLLLVLHPLKEPRHAAGCAVPAVLLVVAGLESLRAAGVRRALTATAALLAVAQYLAVTRGAVAAPYFLDGSLRHAAIERAMREAAPAESPLPLPDAVESLYWRYRQNVALAGFPPNEALALTWQAFPGVAYDLDTLDEPGRLDDRIPYRRFEDLYFLAAINTYNRRCGWRHYHRTLSRETVIEHADFVLLNDVGADEARRRFPQHELVATIEREGGTIRVLHARRATVPYRRLYAREFLRRHPALALQERRTIAEELLLVSVLGGDLPAARALLGEFPVLARPELPARNIYWIGGYPALLDLTRDLIDAAAETEGGRGS